MPQTLVLKKAVQTRTLRALVPMLIGCSAMWAQGPAPTLVVSGTGSTSFDASGSYYGTHTSTPFILNAANPSVPPADNFNVTGSFSGSAATIRIQGNAAFGQTNFNGCPYSPCAYDWGAGATLNVSLQGTAGTDYAIDITRTASISATTGAPIGIYSARADSTSVSTTGGPPSSSFSTVSTVRGTGSITTTISMGAGVGFRLADCNSDSQGCLPTSYPGGGAANVNYTLTIVARVNNQPPLTLSCPTGSGTVNTRYVSAFSASGGTGTYTSYGIATGSLPPGLSLTSAGGVTGTPTTAGPLSFTGRVTDSSGTSATSPSCSITVAPVTPPPLTLSCPTGTGTVNTPYVSAFSASGGTGTYTSYGIATGSLPPGLSLTSAGGVTGTPTTAGPFPFTGRVTDSSGATATSQSCTITIAPAPPPCTYSVSLARSSFPKEGGLGGGTVTASAITCSWLATSTVLWIHPIGPFPTFSTSFTFSVEPNSGLARQGTLSVANQPFTISQEAGADCDPARSQIIQDYITYNNAALTIGIVLFNPAPSCDLFTLNYPQFDINNDTSWALVRAPMITGFANWTAQAGKPLSINSAYRSPAHNHFLPSGDGSRHVFGDAIDVQNTPSNITNWSDLQRAARAAGADWLEPNLPVYPCRCDTTKCGCVHADWRYSGGPYVQ
jgi:hypothetical protein